MLIECTILRQGVTVVGYKMHNYEFMPIPGSLENEWTTSVANIADQEAVDYLIGNEKKGIRGRPQFRPYRPKLAQDDMVARRTDREAKVGQFSGYSIDVLKLMGNDKGYMIKKAMKGEPIVFCGSNGVWTDDVQKIWPFANIADADVFLRAFVGGEPVPAVRQMKPYPCAECEMSFENPIDLATHWTDIHKPVPVNDVKAKLAEAVAAKSAPDGQRYNQEPKEAKK